MIRRDRKPAQRIQSGIADIGHHGMPSCDVLPGLGIQGGGNQGVDERQDDEEMHVMVSSERNPRMIAFMLLYVNTTV